MRLSSSTPPFHCPSTSTPSMSNTFHNNGNFGLIADLYNDEPEELIDLQGLRSHLSRSLSASAYADMFADPPERKATLDDQWLRQVDIPPHAHRQNLLELDENSDLEPFRFDVKLRDFIPYLFRPVVILLGLTTYLTSCSEQWPFTRFAVNSAHTGITSSRAAIVLRRTGRRCSRDARFLRRGWSS